MKTLRWIWILTLLAHLPAAMAQSGPQVPESHVDRVTRLMDQDPRFAAEVTRVMADLEALKGRPTARLRGKDLGEAALEDLQRRSRSLQAEVEESQNVGLSSTWDVIVVGAGLHDEIITTELERQNPFLRVLTVHSEDRLPPPVCGTGGVGAREAALRDVIALRRAESRGDVLLGDRVLSVQPSESTGSAGFTVALESGIQA